MYIYNIADALFFIKSIKIDILDYISFTIDTTRSAGNILFIYFTVQNLSLLPDGQQKHREMGNCTCLYKLKRPIQVNMLRISGIQVMMMS